MIPIGVLRVVVPVLAVIAIVGIAVGGTASLATDVGYTDQEVCETLATHGHWSVQSLEQVNFPRATMNAEETYRLSVRDETKAYVRINWDTDEASCVPLTSPEEPTVHFEMAPEAYQTLTGEIVHVIETGNLSGHGLGNWLVLAFKTDVYVDGEKSSEYKWRLADWAAVTAMERISGR